MTSLTAACRKRLHSWTIWPASRPDLLIDCLAHPSRLQRLGPDAWDRLLPQARESHMLGTLWHLLQEQNAGDEIPAEIRRHLQAAWHIAKRRVLAIQWELRCLRRELPTLQHGRPILLKGVAYIARELPHADTRLCADVDVLVPRGEIRRVEHMLGWAGWTAGELDPYDERYYREWMHQIPPLQHRRRGSTLDLHHNILPETARNPPDPERVIERSEALPQDPVFATPAPAHMAIHSAVHLFADSEWDKAVRDFYDVDRLLRTYGDRDGKAFWDELVAETDRMMRGREMFYALRYCSRWFGTPVPAEVLDRMRRHAPPVPLLIVMDRIFRCATAAQASGPHPRVTKLCRGFLLIRSHWIKMPPVMLARHLFHKAFLSPDPETP